MQVFHPRDLALITIYTILDAKISRWNEFEKNLRRKFKKLKSIDGKDLYIDPRLTFCHQILFQCNHSLFVNFLEGCMNDQLKHDLIEKNLLGEDDFILDIIEGKQNMVDIWHNFSFLNPDLHNLDPTPFFTNTDFNIIYNYLEEWKKFWNSCVNRLTNIDPEKKEALIWYGQKLAEDQNVILEIPI